MQFLKIVIFQDLHDDSITFIYSSVSHIFSNLVTTYSQSVDLYTFWKQKIKFSIV